MKQFNISAPKTFQKDGQDKTIWLQVGSMRVLDDGKIFIELNHLPNQTFMAFEQKKEKEVEINF